MKRIKKDLGKLNPRFAKPKTTQKINFTKRTLDRLFYSWRFGLLDDLHLTKLLGGYSRQTHRELELTKAGLIYHPEAQVPLRAVCTNIHWISALTSFGADILASKGFRIDPTKHRERYRRHKAYNAILHDLNRSDYLVEMDCAVQTSDTLSIRHQDELFNEPYTETISFPSLVEWQREFKSVSIEPDGIFSIKFTNLPKGRQEKYFALEIDQDTEANVRYKKFWEYKSVLKTMIAYAEAHKRGIVDEKLKISNLRTIFVTTTDQHVQNIIKDAGKHYIAKCYPTNACLFVSRERLEKFDPLNAEYKNAAGKSVLISELKQSNN